MTELFRSLPHEKFLQTIRDLGEPAYKVDPIKAFIYRDGIASFDEITTLMKRTRAQLAEKYDLSFPTIQERSVAPDGTVKMLLNWNGVAAEAVLMPSVKGWTLCISTQAGCRLGCGFCATGTLGLSRNLSFGEILDQILVLGGEGAVTRIVVMGMGEPMENLAELVPALRFATDPKGLGLSRKKITVSTVGLCPEIEEFARSGVNVELAISLHATEDKARTKLIPVNKKYPIEKLLSSAKFYKETANAKVTIEYSLMKDVNDTDEDVSRLANLSRRYDLPVNLIQYNPVNDLPFEPSPRLDDFARGLSEKKAIGVTVRRSKGGTINAACGQLAGKPSR